MIGRVKRAFPNGYGFIQTEDDGDFYFHFSEFDGDWKALLMISPPAVTIGPEVQFKAVSHPKGPRAEKVSLLR